jgi:archaeosortase B (VPXXXP-CTERM-specific)
VWAFLRRHRPLLQHWGLFLVILGLLVALDEWASDALNRRFSEITAAWTAGSLRLLGLRAGANGVLVQATNVCRYQIIGECTAYFPCAVYAAAVASYPSRIVRRILGLALGIPLLLLLNQVRLVSLCFIQRSYPEYFEAMHLLVWQSLFVFFAVLLWIAWVATLGGADERRPA